MNIFGINNNIIVLIGIYVRHQIIDKLFTVYTNEYENHHEGNKDLCCLVLKKITGSISLFR